MRWLPSLVAFVAVGSLLLAALGCASSHETPYVQSVEARDFLTLPVVVEVVSVEGRDLKPSALALLSQRITENGAGPPLVVASKAQDKRVSWSDRDLFDFEHAHEQFRGRAARLFVAVLGGTYSSANASGVQYSSHGIALFPDVWGVEADWGARCLVHEFGHVIGLVNDAARADRLHPFHDPDPRCVMFYSLTLPGLSGDDYCAACKRDLAATKAQ